MDIIFSILLLLFSGYAYYYVGVKSPSGTATELGAAFWPRIILIAMIILLAVNIYTTIKKSKAEGKGLFKDIDLKEFFTSKLFIGMVIIAVMAFLLPKIGFIPTCFLFLMAYGRLLGEKNYIKLAIFSALITVLLYIIFQGALDIMLARGTGVFRTFARSCERLLPF